jgi:hypothetical protein
MRIFVKSLTNKTPHLRLVGIFPDKSPLRSRSLRLARQVSALHEEFLSRTRTFRHGSDNLLTRGVSSSDYSFARVVSVSD